MQSPQLDGLKLFAYVSDAEELVSRREHRLGEQPWTMKPRKGIELSSYGASAYQSDLIQWPGHSDDVHCPLRMEWRRRR